MELGGLLSRWDKGRWRGESEFPAMARCSHGVGTNLHLLGELIKSEEKLNLTHVPYRNFGTAFQDAMAGRVDLVVAGLPPVAGLVAAKKLKVLVTTAPERVPALPDTPTMAELGTKDLTFVC
jgi:tripartite-type tricarboxylate transporter receptor subunit TctC